MTSVDGDDVVAAATIVVAVAFDAAATCPGEDCDANVNADVAGAGVDAVVVVVAPVWRAAVRNGCRLRRTVRVFGHRALILHLRFRRRCREQPRCLDVAVVAVAPPVPVGTARSPVPVRGEPR